MQENTHTAALRFMHIHPDDNVAVALTDLSGARTAAQAGATVRTRIPAGHKFALATIPAGAPLIKYGSIIGKARGTIERGDHVHTDNIVSLASQRRDYSYTAAPPRSRHTRADDGFEGYQRADGRVGTRNEIWVIATSPAVQTLVERIVHFARPETVGKVDGVHAVPHPAAGADDGDVGQRHFKIMLGLVQNPNAGEVLLVGSQNANQAVLSALDHIPVERRARIRALSPASALDEVEGGISAIVALAQTASDDQRRLCQSADLVLGLKCGGSDAICGVTANPLLGILTDRVCDNGGAAILTEIPEILGAIPQLKARAASQAVAADIDAVIEGFRARFADSGVRLDSAPSPASRQGGLSTLEEKSLVALQKAGSSPIGQVVRYGGQAPVRSGLSLLESPGNDAVSTTALAAAGANLILFTTGAGTPLGTLVPTLKLSSRSVLAHSQPAWIDFDAGDMIRPDGADNLPDALLELVLRTASGRLTRNEVFDERQVTPWQSGATL